MGDVCRIAILGSAGSIGTQALDVLAHLNREHAEGRWATRYEVVGLATGRRADVLAMQAQHWPEATLALRDAAETSLPRAAITGADGAERIVRETKPDLVIAAIVGFAGVAPTLAAVELGIDVALANKESLVAAGDLIINAAQRTGAQLRPVDSEHSALWQALAAAPRAHDAVMPVPPLDGVAVGVRRLILTASGGPFRKTPAADLYNATPAAALDHPTWDMGPKVTIDCASLTNKALELLEAHWLFGVGPDRLAVVIHPQSIVHSMIEMDDGSVIAQLGTTDMRTPIQYAITHPERAQAPVSRLNLAEVGRLDFEEPDHERFPALRLAERVMRDGGTAGAIFNAANEAAVEAFIDGRIPFGRIGELVRDALDEVVPQAASTLDEIKEADSRARAWVSERLRRGR